MKVYKVKVNGKVYEVEVETVDEVKGSIATPVETTLVCTVSTVTVFTSGLLSKLFK